MSVNQEAKKNAEQACRRLQDVLKENLSACVLYGSAVRGDMIPDRSDINLLIVLNCSTPEAHQAVAEELRRFEKIAPFVLSKWELPRSRLVFAVKFHSIQRNYLVLCGEDPLKDFSPSRELLLFLCEQSLRNLRLRLKHAFIKCGQTPNQYQQRLLKAVPSLFVTLSETLRCAGIEIPRAYKDRPVLIGRELGADVSVLEELRELKQQSRKWSAADAFRFHSRVFQLLSRSLDWVKERWPQAINIK